MATRRDSSPSFCQPPRQLPIHQVTTPSPHTLASSTTPSESLVDSCITWSEFSLTDSGFQAGGSSSLSTSVYSSISAAHPTAKRPNRDSSSPTAQIDLISILQPETRIPLYRLRVDPCTAFQGYRHRDFRQARRASRKPDLPVPRSPNQLLNTNTGYWESAADTGEDSTQPGEASRVESEDEATAGEEVEGSEEAESENHFDEEEEEEPLDLTSEQIERTLDYFLLCGLRVSQMAKTYEDLEAMTLLLEEKQNDLELAAKIGKNLLDKNHDLEKSLLETEKKLIATEEIVGQLRHNLSIKDNLLQIYYRDTAESPSEDPTTISSGWISPVLGATAFSDSGEGFSLASVNFSQLNRRVRDLEEENIVLRQERNRLTTESDQLDEHESVLIRDCARQLVSANMHIRALSDELARKSDAYLTQHSEITRLLTSGVDMDGRVKQLNTENGLLMHRLDEQKVANHRLTSDLCSLRDKYDESISLYNDARAEVRALRKRSRRANLRCNYLSSPMGMTPSSMSLQRGHSAATVDLPHLSSPVIGDYELHRGETSSSSSSLNCPDEAASGVSGLHSLQEQSLASDLAQTAAQDGAAGNVERLFRTMEQARFVRDKSDQLEHQQQREAADQLRVGDYTQDETVCSSGFVSGSEPSERPRLDPRDGTMRPQLDDLQPLDRLSIHSSPVRLRSSRDSLKDGLKRHSWLGCQPYHEDNNNNVAASINATNWTGSSKHRSSWDDSLLSCDPSILYGQSYNRLPQRLQLIKPIDGSDVLQQWQRLATPSFAHALFDAPLPRVQSRVGAPPGSELEYTERDRNHRSESVGPSHFGSPMAHWLNGQKAPKSGDFSLSSTQLTSNGLASRFGASFHSQLPHSAMAQSNQHSRSMEHLPPISGTTATATRRPQRSSLTAADPSSSPFSLASLVSAFLPFSLTPDPSAQLSTTEPIRIRHRSPTRGLLDVSLMGSDSTTPNRSHVATPTSEAASRVGPSTSRLPGATPPSVVVSYPRRATNSSATSNSTANRTGHLSGITEESGSPPKPGDEGETDRSSSTSCSVSPT